MTGMTRLGHDLCARSDGARWRSRLDVARCCNDREIETRERLARRVGRKFLARRGRSHPSASASAERIDADGLAPGVPLADDPHLLVADVLTKPVERLDTSRMKISHSRSLCSSLALPNRRRPPCAGRPNIKARRCFAAAQRAQRRIWSSQWISPAPAGRVVVVRVADENDRLGRLGKSEGSGSLRSDTMVRKAGDERPSNAAPPFGAAAAANSTSSWPDIAIRSKKLGYGSNSVCQTYSQHIRTPFRDASLACGSSLEQPPGWSFFGDRPPRQ